MKLLLENWREYIGEVERFPDIATNINMTKNPIFEGVDNHFMRETIFYTLIKNHLPLY